MAVAKDQIDELLEVIERYVPEIQVPLLLNGLEFTEAFEKNRSFRATVTRIQDRYRQPHLKKGTPK